MFVGRERELESLNRAFASDRFEMAIVYGRRRIGKTFLISRFIEDKPALFFTAQEVNDRTNLDLFTRRVCEFFNLPTDGLQFRSWDGAFEFIAERAKEQRVVLALDEFPYACAANTALPSILQIAIDHRFLHTKLFLILCGSQVSFMEREVLGYKSPLFGRRTMQMRIDGFDYIDTAKMLPGYGKEDWVKFYACVGGTPHYLAQVDPSLSFEDNIKSLYFHSSGYLYGEPLMLLQQELREPALYNAIIGAVAGGASRLNDIVLRVGEEKTKVMKYITTLVDLHILTREYPFGEDPDVSRKGIYRIADSCYYFWYRFVFPNRSEIENGLGDVVADERVLPAEPLSAFVGRPAFEDVCLQYLRRLSAERQLPFLPTQSGRWWGNDPKAKAEADLDVVLANSRTGQIIAGECKWKNEKVSGRDVESLLGKDHLLPAYSDRYYYYFSKSGYSESALHLASKNDKLQLVSLDDLFSRDGLHLGLGLR